MEHNTDGLGCWCRPTPKGGDVWLHKSWEEFLEYVADLEEAYGKSHQLEAENERLRGWLQHLLDTHPSASLHGAMQELEDYLLEGKEQGCKHTPFNWDGHWQRKEQG